MSMVFAVLSFLKSEINWIISSLAVADTAAEGSAPGDAPAADAAAHDANAGNTPDAKGTEMTSIVDTHADDAPAHHHAADASAQEDYLYRAAYDANADAATPVDSGGLLLAQASVSELVPDAPPAVSPILIEPSVTGASGHAGSAHDADLFGDLSFNPTPFTVLDDGDGTSIVGFAHGNSGSHPGGGGPGGNIPWSVLVDSTGVVGAPSASGLTFNLIFDQTATKLPADFASDVEAVAKYFASNFSDHITITIDVGYGEVAGHRVPASALGESITNLASVSYSDLYYALTHDGGSTTPPVDDGRGTLPSGDPTPGGSGHYVVSSAEAKALSLPGSDPITDGYVGFSSFRGIFDYNTADGMGASQYDFYAVAAHEISEVMGRMLFVGGSSNSYDPLDLFHYSSEGIRDFSGSAPSGFFSYFSINSGTDDLHHFNTSPSGDFADWASGQPTDAYDAFGGQGVPAPIDPTFDLPVMDAIGWDRIV